ncbi:MAG: hypothetical protein O3B13_03765 [Planctomycetota bacterium]|nr:hypothetical protein [Planctomycetota bacterium]MDA1162198.1 hypothetical protein [Planctomycetota bacterium]
MTSGRYAPDLQCRLRQWMIFCTAIFCLCLSGCHLLDLPAIGSETASNSNSDLKLPPIVASRDAVQLEILFVDRPINDGLLGESLWNQVDQIAGMSANIRSNLRANGWRVGHASSHPPRALEQLLEMSSGRPEVIDHERRLIGRRVALAAGSTLPIDLTDLQSELQFRPDFGEDVKTYSNARCILNVQIDREQDGWVRLNFTPEIHHGQNWLRPVATQLDWTRRRGQLIEPMFDQKFSLSLNVGEMAIVTADGDDKETIGNSFFRSVHESGGLQRLLVVRVANMRKMIPVYDN